MAKIYCKSSYLLRRDTAANWNTKNPILREGEEGYETDTGRRKVGNGTTEWNNLKYDSGIVDQTYSPTSENAQSGKAVAQAVAPKLDKPSMPPAVGNILKVLSVNDDGTFTCGWSDAPSGGAVDDVQINGASIVTDGVANIPIAKNNSVGIVAPYKSYGMLINNNGILSADNISESEYDNAPSPLFIGKGTLEKAKYNLIKTALTDGKGAAWTADEQAAARSRIGTQGQFEKIVDITLEELSIPILNLDSKIDVICVIDYPGEDETRSNYFWPASNISPLANFFSTPVGNKKAMVTLTMSVYGDYFITGCSINNGTDNHTSNWYQKSLPVKSGETAIRTLKLSNEWPAGTRVVVYAR